jgi:hypothetical protein
MEQEVEYSNRWDGFWCLGRPIAATGTKNVVATRLSGGVPRGTLSDFEVGN